ncbi:MAG: cation transporter [Desulfuromonadales bacterium]|nr:cation transporter [Desulfuromonadales bacterium]MDW7757573.1 cation transporter [Desulfuromonadales bacterium]
MKFRVALLAVTLTVLAATVTIAFRATLFPQPGALAEYAVSNLTCGSCVENIRNALSRTEGVGEIEVSVATGRSRVVFDPNEIEPSRIAEIMEAAGYPSKLQYVLSSDEYKGRQKEEDRLAERFVARVGDRLIPRTEFQTELDLLGRSRPDGDTRGLGQVAWERLLQREVLFAEAERQGLVVSDQEVSLEIDGMKEKVDNFESLILKRYDSLEAFHSAVKMNLLFERLFEKAVPATDTDPAARNIALQKWYSDLLTRCPVTIFDPSLKIAAQNAGGCGSACCG